MSFYFAYGNNFLLLKSTIFPDGPVWHGFSTRLGRGIPGADFRLAGGEPAPGGYSPEILLRELAPGHLKAAWPVQTHSRTVWTASWREDSLYWASGGQILPPGQPAPEGDAVTTSSPGLLLAVKTADCFPLLIWDPAGQVAAVHSGWRGTLQDIAGETIQALIKKSGSEPGQLRVAAGPGIQACCYRVGEELASQFATRFPGSVRPAAGPGGPHRLDLRECLRQSLGKAGVLPAYTDLCPLCTCCRPGLFFSYRREGAGTGRMMALMMLNRPANGTASG